MTLRVHLVNALALLLAVALISAVLTIRARSVAEWRALVAAVGGEDVVIFRTKQNADFDLLGSWTPRHLDDLRAIPGVREVLWAGGYNYAQGPSSSYVLPIRVASPGLLSARRATFVAGRDLTDDDAGKPRVVLSEAHARAIFPDLTLDDVIGRYVETPDGRLQIVGVVVEADAAYQAARTPPSRFLPGEYDVQDVYVRIEDGADMEQITAQLNAYVAEQPGLTVYEAVPYSEFVRPGVIDERLEYVREIRALFGWLVGFALLLALLNLFNQALLAAAKKRRGWALRRVLGASRGRLIVQELLGGAALEWLAIIVGVVAGLGLGWRLGGLVTAEAALLGLAVGVISLLLGSLPLVWAVLRLYPYRALRQSRGLLRHPVLNVSGALGLAVGLALVVVAGGFRDMGRHVIGGEIDAIGADLVIFERDYDSILPAPLLNEADLAALEQAYPDLPATLVYRLPGEARVGERTQEVEIYRGNEAFVPVSGTRLAAGAWRDDGVVLGSGVAQALFPNLDTVDRAVGETVTLRGHFGSLDAPVAAVAAPPTTARLEALQLPENAVLVPRALLPVVALKQELYARVGGLSDEEIGAIGAFLSARYPDAAPVVARYPAASYQSYLERLEAQLREFNLVAVLIFVLAAVGLATLATVRALGRRYVRGLERAFGARRADVFQSELSGALRLALAVGGLGAAAGVGGLWLWSARQGYAFVWPTGWLVAALMITLGIGLPIGAAVARRSAAEPPIAILRGEA